MRCLFRVALFALVLIPAALVGAAETSPAAPAAPAATAGLPSESSLDQLAWYVNDLAAPEMKGRLTGSESGKKAEEYVEKTLRATGLQVKTQEVAFPLYEVRSPLALSLLGDDGKPAKEFKYVDEFREVDFAGFGDVTGELVFAGWGMEAPGQAPYPEGSVKGKIAVILSGAPQGTDPELVRLDRKLDYAFRNGAAGVIVVPSGRAAQRMAESPKEAKMRAMDWKFTYHPELSHLDMPVLFLLAGAVEPLTGKKTEDLVADPSTRALGKRIRMVVNGRVDAQAKGRNVLAVLPGTDPALSKEVILIGAHYDHLGVGGDGRVYCGAADNASGTAVVMEAARLFAASPVKPKRTVVFALWCAEEIGLYGSTHYAEKEPLFPLEDTKLMIQIDSLCAEYGPCISNVTDNPVIQSFIGKAAAEKRVEVLDTKGQCASDDCPFLAKKVPACRFVAYGPHHHQDTDTMANLNKEMVKKCADLVVEGIRNTAY